jgi:formylmethanofuran dehydrogenase subunit E
MDKIHKSVTLERIEEAIANDDMIGICLNCGEEHGEPLEPDARKVLCDNCGEEKVYGAEEILFMLA